MELPLTDYFEVTDKHHFLKERFKWPDSNHVNIVRLLSANLSKQFSFKLLSVSEIAEKIGHLPLCQTNPFSNMRFEVSCLESDNVELTYTGFNLSPIAIQSTTGHSLCIALEHYQKKIASFYMQVIASTIG